jgi:Integrase core domain
MKNAQGLYEIRCHGERNVDLMYHPRNGASFALTAEISTGEGKQLWHERMGHANDKAIAQLSKQQDRTGVNLSSKPDTVSCGECVQAKLPASSMTKSLVPPDTKVGELVFSDICGKLPIVGYNNALYFVTFTDAVSKHLFVNAIEDKAAGTVLVVSKKYCNWIANHFHASVKRLHTDNGGEYVNDIMKEYVDSKGIEHTSTAPYQPQSNVNAERVSRTLMGK